jgi:peptidoglycan/xylan/chitin deacetylase (PgdA/CDA1 family)
MSVIRTFAKECLWKTGAYALVAAARPWHGVPVLAYHGVRDASSTTLGTSEELHVRRQTLERQLKAVRSLATPISLSQWRTARRRGRGLPPRSVLVTFDDGYRSVMEHAVPLLERYDIPAVVFVCTGPAVTGELFWFDALERHGRGDEVEAVKRLPHDAWKRLTAEMRTVARTDDERAVMTRDEVAELARHPLIEIGAHTVDHPILAQASPASQRQQIAGSIETLRQWTRQPIRAFAYPNGRYRDFTPDTVRIVRECGVDSAFSTEPRLAASDDALSACPRFTMLDTISDARLAQYLSLSWPRAIA